MVGVPEITPLGSSSSPGGGLPEPVTHLAYAPMTDPAAPGHLYAALSSGEVWHTADYGDSWGRLPFNLGSFHGKMILV
jgi:hypothetical protein